MISKQNAARAMQGLRSAITSVRANQAMEDSAAPMRAAVLRYIDALEDAGGDIPAVFEIVHEIRGCAETAGLSATGRIAESLCRYLDEMERAQRAADPAIVSLHVSAAIRSARTEETDQSLSEKVAAGLSALVGKKTA
jgi:hypothetical protein